MGAQGESLAELWLKQKAAAVCAGCWGTYGLLVASHAAHTPKPMSHGTEIL